MLFYNSQKFYVKLLKTFYINGSVVDGVGSHFVVVGFYKEVGETSLATKQKTVTYNQT